MPARTKASARQKAEEKGLATVRGTERGKFVVPADITTAAGKAAFRDCRESGKTIGECSLLARRVQSREKNNSK